MLTQLDDLGRLREEDPFTGIWTNCVPTRVIGLRSRFEVDLNRPRENEDAGTEQLVRGEASHLIGSGTAESHGGLPELVGTFAETLSAEYRCVFDCRALVGPRWRQNQRSGGGMLQMDRLLPFLCVYRRNPRRRDEGTAQLVMSKASFLSAPGTATERQGLKRLVRRVAETAIERLGAFLILEIWSGEDHPEHDASTGEVELPRPAFRLLTRRPHRPEGTVATLQFYKAKGGSQPSHGR